MRSGGHGGGHGHAAPKDNVDLLSQMGYENRDISLNTIVLWIFVLFCFIAVTTVGTIFLYKFFVPASAELERVAPLASVRRVPPYPQLQASPKRDMIEFRQAEDAVLGGVTKAADGHVNLPIDRAIDAIAARGIAGVSGTGEKPVSNSYPGSGDFSSGQKSADNGGTGDMTDYNPTTAAHDAEPGAGGTGSVNAQPTPGSSTPNVSEPISGPRTTAPAPLRNGTNP